MHSDADGWPLDGDAYGRRQSQRDAETAEAFEPLRPAAHRVLATARTQLTALPAARANKGWAWQLTTLHYALERLDALDQEWSHARRHLPADADGTAVTIATAP